MSFASTVIETAERVSQSSRFCCAFNCIGGGSQSGEYQPSPAQAGRGRAPLFSLYVPSGFRIFSNSA